jgi:peptide/nickel transport system substrate-binding protein
MMALPPGGPSGRCSAGKVMASRGGGASGQRGGRAGLLVALLLAAACSAAPPRPTSGGAAENRAAAPGAAAAAPAGPSRLTIVLATPITSHNPYAQSGGDVTTAWSSVFQGLVRLNADDKSYEPLAAERWEVVAPTTWRFYLRRAARFSDGSALTAADVQHSLVDRALGDQESVKRSTISNVVGATAIDDYTVDVTTRAPDATILLALSSIPITSKAQYDALGKQAADRRPVSAGPYTLQDLVPDQRMVLAKNPHYWGDVATAPDEVIIRWMKEPVVALTAALGGEVDMTTPLPPNLIASLGGNVRAQEVPSGVIYFLGLGAVGPLTDKRVRQAISYAVDKDGIITNILKDQAQRLDGPLLASSIGYSADLTPIYTYDPARARQLLAEAGFAGGFSLDLHHPVGRYTNDVDIAAAIAAQLGQVGIQVTLKPTDSATFLTQTRNGAYPSFLYGAASVEEPNRYLVQFFRSGAGRYLSGWQNDDVDRLLDAETAEFDLSRRAAVMRELQSRLNDEAPAVPLLSFTNTLGLANRWQWEPRYGSVIYFDTFRRR